MTRTSTAMTICTIAVVLAAGCANTVQGVQQDAERATERAAAGIETADVKSALIADGRVDASNINVDTSASTRTVTLKGSVSTEQEKQIAEQIAGEQAEGYRVTNQLVVAAK